MPADEVACAVPTGTKGAKAQKGGREWVVLALARFNLLPTFRVKESRSGSLLLSFCVFALNPR